MDEVNNQKIIQIERREGAALKAGDRTITPVGRAVIMRAPFFGGRLVWNHPVEVRVQDADGQVMRVPVVDRTRQVQLIILGLGILGSILISGISRRRSVSK